MARAIFAFLFLSTLSFAAEQVDLPPLIKEGTPGDALMHDAVVPEWDEPVNPASGSGSIQKSLGDQLALPVTGTEAPGGLTQFRGLGRSAEDTDVQALGISLNPPQGGGFDLSVFPQFLWARYEYQAGPALGTFDPRGTGGSLTLVPWTEQALGLGAFSGRVAGLGSTANAFQVSAAASDGHSLAAVAGSSFGDAQGPSAALSGKWRVSEGETVSLHVLMTDLDVKSPGPNDITPLAHQQTVRGIPLLQLDSQLGAEALLKSSVFVDDQYLLYQDPSASALPLTQDHVLQAGTQQALFLGAWKVGAGLRGSTYQTIGFGVQSESVLDLLVSRAFEPLGGLLVEPTVRLVGVSGYALEPEASLGVRDELGSGTAWFVRGGLSRHFPSLTNRFYSYPGFPGYPGFVGNPALAPEKDWTATAGIEHHGERLHAVLQAYGQLAQDAQVRAPLNPAEDTELNLGQARVASLLASIQGEWTPWLETGVSGTLNLSQITQLGLAFPGLPVALAVAHLGVHSSREFAGGVHRWEARLFERVSGDAVADASGARLPAYHEEDLQLTARLEPGWEAIARVDDLTDQRPQLAIVGYPGVGRTFSALLSKGF